MQRLLENAEIIQENDEFYTCEEVWEKVPAKWIGKAYCFANDNFAGYFSMPIKREVRTHQMNYNFEVLIDKMEVQITESEFIKKTLFDMRKLFSNMF